MTGTRACKGDCRAVVMSTGKGGNHNTKMAEERARRETVGGGGKAHLPFLCLRQAIVFTFDLPVMAPTSEETRPSATRRRRRIGALRKEDIVLGSKAEWLGTRHHGP